MIVTKYFNFAKGFTNSLRQCKLTLFLTPPKTMTRPQPTVIDPATARYPSTLAREAAAQAKRDGYGYLELAILVFDAFNPGAYSTVEAFMEAFMSAELPEEVLGASELLAQG